MGRWAIWATALLAAALATPAMADRPAPLNPKPVLVAVDGAGETELASARGLLDGYYRAGGWGASVLTAVAFDGCRESGDRVSCVRETLKPLRVEAGEVAIVVLVAPAPAGGVRLTCVGGDRRNAWSDEEAQNQTFSAAEIMDPGERARAETCVGKAYGEYMIP